MRTVSRRACQRFAASQEGQWACLSSESKKGREALGAVSSAIVGEYFLISEYAVRGAKPSCVVKMSKTQARQTSVLYSVTLPGGNALRSSSRFFFVVDIQSKQSADYTDMK